MLATNVRRKGSQAPRTVVPALLKGLVFGPGGRALTPSHTRKSNGRLYRYYVSQEAIKRGHGACPIGNVAANELESVVIGQVRALLRAPEVVVRTWRSAREDGERIDEREVATAIQRLDPIWDHLFPAEQARIIRLLVERVDVANSDIQVRMRTEGLDTLVADLRQPTAEERTVA